MSEYDAGWRRLNALSLLLGPVKVGKELVVPAIGVLIGISNSGSLAAGLGTTLLMVVAAVVISSIPWLTTRFRLTPTQLERRSGLVGKQQLTAPLDRIRSVDLEANLLHRVLGLTRVQIGTGVDEKRIELDALSRGEAEQLRRFLLDRSPVPVAEPVTGEAVAPAPQAAPTAVAELDWGWIRFAPFSLSRLAVVAAALGVLSQFSDNLPAVVVEDAGSTWNRVLTFALPLVVAALALGALVGWVVISCAGFVWQWAGLRVAREHGTVKVTSGLVSTRAVSIEEARIRGMSLREPLLLRLVGGAELQALSTGVGKGGRTQILPPAPLAVVLDVGALLLGARSPLEVRLRPHGFAARRRCFIRAQWPALGLLLAGTAAGLYLGPWWLGLVLAAVASVAGVWAGASAYRHLGHHLSADHLVAGGGVTTRLRDVLEIEGIIGWVVQQSFFQRRRGLATLVATTAAGGESVQVRDVPLDVAVRLIGAVDPALVA